MPKIDEFVEGSCVENGKIIARIAIREPVWNGRRIGLHKKRTLAAEKWEVKVNYRLKGGDELIPQVLGIDCSKVKKYETMMVGPNKNVEVYMVPIAQMHEVKEWTV